MEELEQFILGHLVLLYRNCETSKLFKENLYQNYLKVFTPFRKCMFLCI